MSRLFRHPHQGLYGYVSLTLFALVYLAAIALTLTTDGGRTESTVAADANAMSR
jgi:hypothetical protein